MKPILGLVMALAVAACAGPESSTQRPVEPAARVPDRTSPASTINATRAPGDRTVTTAVPPDAPIPTNAGAGSPLQSCPAGLAAPRSTLCPPSAPPIPPLPPVPPLPPIPVPPVHAAHIAICSSVAPDARPRPVWSSAVCGTGFAAGETVTLVFRGRLGVISWTAVATVAGGFVSALPQGACRDLPATLIARGNRGRVSNLLPLVLLPCSPRL